MYGPMVWKVPTLTLFDLRRFLRDLFDRTQKNQALWTRSKHTSSCYFLEIGTAQASYDVSYVWPFCVFPQIYVLPINTL